MTCPRCGSLAIMRNHDSVGCLACSHPLREPARKVWDAGSNSKGTKAPPGPPVTEEERLLWRLDRERRQYR